MNLGEVTPEDQARLATALRRLADLVEQKVPARAFVDVRRTQVPDGFDARGWAVNKPGPPAVDIVIRWDEP